MSEETSLIDKLKKKGTLDKSVYQTLLFRLSGLGLIFLLQILLARLMGPKSYGDYTVIITTVNLLLVLSMFGFDSAILRFLPSSLEKGDEASAVGFIKFANRVMTVLVIACAVGIFIFLLSKSRSFNRDFSEGLFWAMILLPFLAYTTFSAAVLRALRRIRLSLLPAYFLFPVMMGIMSWIYYRGENKLTADAAMVLNLGVSAIICFYINRKAKKALRESVGDTQANYTRRAWISVSSVLFLTTAMDLLLKQSDILMVGYFLNNMKAGFYAVAAKLATLSALGLAVADYVVMPRIAGMFESRQYSKLQKMIRNASFQILSISLPVIIGLAIFGKMILGFFGLPYKDSYVALLILLIGQLVNSATGMVGGLMMMTGHQRKFFLFYAGAIALQFLLNVLLIKPLGINGAAIATSTSMIFLNVSAYLFVSRKLKIKASVF